VVILDWVKGYMTGDYSHLLIEKQLHIEKNPQWLKKIMGWA
jgi:hypothetical protein